jgi:hypothetical protein
LFFSFAIEFLDYDNSKLENAMQKLAEYLPANQLENIIEAGMKAESEIKAMKEQNDHAQERINTLQHTISNIKINHTIDVSVENVETKLEEVRNKYSGIKTILATYEADLKNEKEKLEKLNQQKKEIEADKKALSKLKTHLEEWQYIAKMLNADKIPALELEIIIGGIDQTATEIINPFMSGRYSFKTVTQIEGKNKAVDKFDIIIHDAETGNEASIFFKNPGHKAFFSDCYIKALIQKRNEKSVISYSPIIMDESDGPISPEQIPVYYDIQNNYFQDNTVLIVSHSTDAKQFIQNIVNIEELKK